MQIPPLHSGVIFVEPKKRKAHRENPARANETVTKSFSAFPFPGTIFPQTIRDRDGRIRPPLIPYTFNSLKQL